jgi:hypothetical protein
MGELGLEFDPLSSHVSLCGFVGGQCRLLWPFKMAQKRWNDLRQFLFFNERIDSENDALLLYVSFIYAPLALEDAWGQSIRPSWTINCCVASQRLDPPLRLPRLVEVVRAALERRTTSTKPFEACGTRSHSDPGRRRNKCTQPWAFRLRDPTLLNLNHLFDDSSLTCLDR